MISYRRAGIPRPRMQTGLGRFGVTPILQARWEVVVRIPADIDAAIAAGRLAPGSYAPKRHGLERQL